MLGQASWDGKCGFYRLLSCTMDFSSSALRESTAKLWRSQIAPNLLATPFGGFLAPPRRAC